MIQFQKKMSNETCLKLETGTEPHSVAETGTELKPSKPHNAAGPVLWFPTSGSTLSHWIDIYMDHLGSMVLRECKLAWTYSPESTLLCNEYTWYCCCLSSVLYSLKAGSLFSPNAQHAQLAISVLLFSKVQWKQQTTVLLYCNALFCIPFPSAEDKWIVRTADMTLAVSVALSPHNFPQVNSKNQLHDADISLLINVLTIKISHYLMKIYCPVGSRRSSAIFPSEAKNTLI